MKIINRFKSIEKTKRIGICFITVSFVFIIGIGVYQGFNHHSYVDQDEKETVQEEVNDQVEEKEESQEQKDKEDSSQQTVETKPQEHAQTKKENQKKKESQTTQKQEKKQEEKQEEKPLEKANISIHIQVIGMNETVLSESIQVDKESTPFTVLKNVTSLKGIKVTTSGFGSMIYVTGIGDLKEKQHGSSSGWMYKVNNVSPNMSAGSYKLKDNDQVLWYYVYDE